MATIKFYTEIEQSKILSKILPIESSDMWWTALNWQETEYYVEVKQDGINQPKKAIPCWSLAVLLNFLPKKYTNNKNQVCSLHIDIEDSETPYLIWYVNPEHEGSIVEIKTEEYSNPVDACYEMVLKLHELNLL